MAFKKGSKVKLAKDFLPEYKKGDLVTITEAYEAEDFSIMCYEVNTNITVEEGDIE